MFSKQLQKTSPANPISQGSSNAKRMRETTPTPTPPNAKSKAKEEEIQVSEIALSSPSKRLKKEYGDDSNQPESVSESSSAPHSILPMDNDFRLRLRLTHEVGRLRKSIYPRAKHRPRSEAHPR